GPRSPTPSCASCASCPATSRSARSATACTSRPTRSRRRRCPPTASWTSAAGRRPWRADAPSASWTAERSGQQLRLLVGELLVGQDALVAQRRELLELGDRVLLGGRRGRRGRRLLVDDLLGCGLLRIAVLLAPSPGLPARDAVAYGRRCAGDDGGAGDPAEQTWHFVHS